MKKKKIKPQLKKKTSLSQISDGKVIVSHSQSVRQSENYQSAEANYSVQLTCASDDKTIKTATALMEEYVENHLVVKMHEQRELLRKIS